MRKTLTYRHDMDIIEKMIKKDRYLKPLFEHITEVTITLSDDYFLSLVGAIISQQLSGKVAQVIYQRFLAFYEQDVTPENIVKTDKEALRQLGISYQKVSYLKSLAEAVLDGQVDIDAFENMADEAIINELVQVKGIGRWTAQMFLMFSLGREDVAASLDLGLRKAYAKLINKEVSVKDFENYSDKWKPYRSIVSYYLWKSTDQPKEGKS